MGRQELCTNLFHGTLDGDASARDIAKEVEEKKRFWTDSQVIKASELLAKGYEPKRDDPTKVAEKLTRRMRGVQLKRRRFCQQTS